MAERPYRIVVARPPVHFPAPSREFVVFSIILRTCWRGKSDERGCTPSCPRPVEAVRRRRLVLHVVRKIVEQARNRIADTLRIFELISAGARSARILDFLSTGFHLGEVAGKVAARAPKIDLKGQRVLPGNAVHHPIERCIRNEPPSQ
jgi:hypothetical protein